MIIPTLNIDSKGKITVNITDIFDKITLLRFDSQDCIGLFIPLLHAFMQQFSYGDELGYNDGYVDCLSDYGLDLDEK